VFSFSALAALARAQSSGVLWGAGTRGLLRGAPRELEWVRVCPLVPPWLFGLASPETSPLALRLAAVSQVKSPLADCPSSSGLALGRCPWKDEKEAGLLLPPRAFDLPSPWASASSEPSGAASCCLSAPLRPCPCARAPPGAWLIAPAPAFVFSLLLCLLPPSRGGTPSPAFGRCPPVPTGRSPRAWAQEREHPPRGRAHRLLPPAPLPSTKRRPCPYPCPCHPPCSWAGAQEGERPQRRGAGGAMPPGTVLSSPGLLGSWEPLPQRFHEALPQYQHEALPRCCVG